MTSSFERKVLGGLGVASIVIASVAVFGHVATTRLVDNADRVSRCQTMISALTDFALHVQVISMSTRGYVVTGDQDLLRMCESEHHHVQEHLAEMQRLIQADPPRGKRLAQIQALAVERLEASDQLLEVRRRYGRLAAGIVALTSYRVEVDDPLKHQVEAVVADAQTELSERRAIARGSGRVMFSVLTFSALIERLSPSPPP